MLKNWCYSYLLQFANDSVDLYFHHFQLPWFNVVFSSLAEAWETKWRIFQGLQSLIAGEEPNNGVQQVAFSAGDADASKRINWD